MILLIVVTIIVLCGGYTKYDESKIPRIVFRLLIRDCDYNYPDSSSMWTIDNQGDIYYFNTVRSFEQKEGEDIELIYEELKKDKYTRYVGNIGLDVLKEKYAYLHEILQDNHYKMDVSGYDKDAYWVSDEYKGIRMWNTYAVTKNGKTEMIMLHEEGDVYYTSEDKRMKELADWLDEILQEDIKENKVRCQQLKSEDDYEKWLEYKKLNEKE